MLLIPASTTSLAQEVKVVLRCCRCSARRENPFFGSHEKEWTFELIEIDVCTEVLRSL